MSNFIRRQTNYFLLGFILTFIVYLFVRFDFDKVIFGITISVAGGLLLSVVMFYLRRRMNESGRSADISVTNQR